MTPSGATHITESGYYKLTEHRVFRRNAHGEWVNSTIPAAEIKRTGKKINKPTTKPVEE